MTCNEIFFELETRRAAAAKKHAKRPRLLVKFHPADTTRAHWFKEALDAGTLGRYFDSRDKVMAWLDEVGLNLDQCELTVVYPV